MQLQRADNANAMIEVVRQDGDQWRNRPVCSHSLQYHITDDDLFSSVPLRWHADRDGRNGHPGSTWSSSRIAFVALRGKLKMSLKP